MMRGLLRGNLLLRCCFPLFAVLIAANWPAASPAAETPLDRYVAQPDESFRWSLAAKEETPRGTVYIVDMTSQTWRAEGEVDRTQWQHWLVVGKPPGALPGKAVLFIGGGSNSHEPPRGLSPELVALAEETGAVVAELRTVPNQPLVFHNDGVQRYEDDLLAYGWTQFLETDDPTWIPQLAMAKSAVRAMDTLEELLAAEGHPVEDFIVSGASKRGWTTWLTAAVDDRVEAIVPIVIDLLNLGPSMEHHHAAYGFWAPAIGDYERHGLMQYLHEPEFEAIRKIVDPYKYRDRYTLPKFIVNATGDQFFLPDSSQFYFHDLPGERLLRYVPNTDHGLGGSDALTSIVAFCRAVFSGTPRPRYAWEYDGRGTLRVTTEDQPVEVRLWQGTATDARDFRLQTIGPVFTSRPLEADGDGQYVARLETPPEGWTAFLVGLAFDVGGPAPLKLTTSVYVVPDVLPYGDSE